MKSLCLALGITLLCFSGCSGQLESNLPAQKTSSIVQIRHLPPAEFLTETMPMKNATVHGDNLLLEPGGGIAFAFYSLDTVGMATFYPAFEVTNAEMKERLWVAVPDYFNGKWAVEPALPLTGGPGEHVGDNNRFHRPSFKSWMALIAWGDEPVEVSAITIGDGGPITEAE